MSRHGFTNLRRLWIVCGLSIWWIAPSRIVGEPTTAAVSSFNSYVSAAETRLSQQHQSQDTFLPLMTLSVQNAQRLRGGELIIEQLTPTPGADLSGALLHHWRGTAFVPGAKTAVFERLLRDFQLLFSTLLSSGRSGESSDTTGRPSSGIDAGSPETRHHRRDGYDLRRHLRTA